MMKPCKQHCSCWEAGEACCICKAPCIDDLLAECERDYTARMQRPTFQEKALAQGQLDRSVL